MYLFEEMREYVEDRDLQIYNEMFNGQKLCYKQSIGKKMKQMKEYSRKILYQFVVVIEKVNCFCNLIQFLCIIFIFVGV